MGSEESVCPVCGQPVGTVVKRHKTLGAWVPVWGPGPCHNPGCAARADTDPARPAAGERHTGPGPSGAGSSGPSPSGPGPSADA
ncbi:hypothetical protein [Streptomyces sp. NPDC017095]|uniref:hypothetical protein n=1 Tax=Streptomyces sp. NPDC017095 TaxID=3364977 RepID=UPI0037A17530